MGEIIQKVVLPEELTKTNEETIKVYKKRIKHLRFVIKYYEGEIKKISSHRTTR